MTKNPNLISALLRYNTIVHNVDIIDMFQDVQSMRNEYARPSS